MHIVKESKIKKRVNRFLGLFLSVLLAVGGSTVVYASDNQAPAGYNDSDWSYQYATEEYGYEKIIGAFYQNQYYSYIYDSNGIIVGMKDSDGEQIVLFSYDEYGILSAVYSNESGTWIENNNPNFIGNKNRVLYTGMYYDKETDCYYLNGRFFDPIENKYLDGIVQDNVLTDRNPYLGIQGDVQIAGSVALETAVQTWVDSLLANSSYGVPISYSSSWYSSLSDVELLARAIYCEGGTAYTLEEKAVAWVILNRVNSSSFPNTPSAVLKQSGQFASITGGSSASQYARQPSTNTDRWRNSTYLACLMLTSTSTTDWQRLVGNVINGQLYFYSYTTAKNQYVNNPSTCVFKDSGSKLLYNNKEITTVKVLGYGNVSSFTTLFNNYSPVAYSRNIYYNYK